MAVKRILGFIPCSMSQTVLLIGIDPQLIDFTSPEFTAFPGLTAEKIQAGYDQAVVSLKEHQITGVICWVDFGETAPTVIKTELQKSTYNAVLIGAGIRIPVSNLNLFEKLINTIHEFAPSARIVFNSSPMDTVEAVKRWV